MPTRKIIIILVISLLYTLTTGCTNDLLIEKDPPVNNQSEPLAFAGEYDSTFLYVELSPPLEIATLWDNNNLYGRGSDSVDIDSDGKYDLLIKLSLLNTDSVHLLTNEPSPYPYCKLYVNNGLELVTIKKSYSIGHGSSGHALFVATLDHGERIDTLSEWNEEIPYGIKMWGESPAALMTPPFGDWYYTNSIKYIGIRMNEKYGWIEIDAVDHEKPKILSYAIQK